MKRNDSSLQEDSTAAQAENSVGKLHHSISQAMSHPTPQMLDQAERTLAHTEKAVRQARRDLGGPGVELAEEMLAEEKDRLATLNAKQTSSDQ